MEFLHQIILTNKTGPETLLEIVPQLLCVPQCPTRMPTETELAKNVNETLQAVQNWLK